MRQTAVPAPGMVEEVAMSAVVDHEVATAELAEHLRPVFEGSPDGVYVWLDEHHWMCSERFARMFGYEDAEELNDTPHLLQRLVHEDDQELFSWNYWNRVQALAFPVTFRFRGLMKDGAACLVETDMIPVSYGGHTFAYHFVRKVG
jgi:PAS domain S-box-containing protein